MQTDMYYLKKYNLRSTLRFYGLVFVSINNRNIDEGGFLGPIL